MGRDHSCEVCGTGGFNSEHDEELHRARMVTVRCPVTITSPGPSPGALDMGFKPNEVCGLHVSEPHDYDQCPFKDRAEVPWSEFKPDEASDPTRTAANAAGSQPTPEASSGRQGRTRVGSDSSFQADLEAATAQAVFSQTGRPKTDEKGFV